MIQTTRQQSSRARGSQPTKPNRIAEMEEGKVEEKEVQIFPAEASSKINESLSFDKAYGMTSLGKSHLLNFLAVYAL
jgi:hypothetical protein